MKLFTLGASGGTGRELTQQALQRGHQVTALVRDPARLGIDPHPSLATSVIDVRDPRPLSLGEDAVVLSGLGVTRGESAGTLTAGARAILSARPKRILWLGAYGTGPSAQAAGWATRALLSLMGDRLQDKVTADAQILAAGGTVFHAGPLSLGPLSAARRLVTLQDAPRRFFPARVSRATVAAAMLDEAEGPHRPGVLIPLDH